MDWDECSKTSWAREWLADQLTGRPFAFPVQTDEISGDATASFFAVEVSGDCQVSCKKGARIPIFELSVEADWKVELKVAKAVVEAKGRFLIPEFSSEDDPQVTVINDSNFPEYTSEGFRELARHLQKEVEVQVWPEVQRLLQVDFVEALKAS
mmetsp:Transcript_75345/g.201296  ORF Transcript_75345/g.201296 Transcript_75345/m.201296 type:complete len:153 (-) Transcript_75345:52-510(-)